MKKLLLLGAVAALFWTCSTKLDILDDWKETTVVYALLDQSQPKQYVRIEKAFLGPDNALSMAQQYDSINYISHLTVSLQEKDNNNNVVNSFQLSPDTISYKESGIFNFPEQVVYSMNSPAFNTSHKYHLIVSNDATGNSVDATTSLVSDFSITRPTGPTIGLIKVNPTTTFEIQWNGSAQARVYQVSCLFHYKERDLANNVTLKTAPEWLISTVQTSGITATDVQSVTFDPNNFYRYLATVLQHDQNVSARQADYLEFIVYAGAEEMQTYMAVNSPSTSLVQEKPLYTNINGGLGLFSSRYRKIKSNLTLTPQSQDTLAKGQFSCDLQFLDRNSTITNNLDLPPGCH